MTKKICVTGAAGYIGSHIVKQLLERGYNVVGTVRDPSNTEHNEHLHRLEGAADRLTLVAADLNSKDGFVKAFEGCTAVIHTASPLMKDGGENDFVPPAVNGNVNVLNAAKEVGTITRIAITSSMAAVCGAPGSHPDDYVYSESDWSDPENQRQRSAWYALSKTLAEQKAWELSKSLGIEIAVICPTLVIGPLLQKKINTSTSRVLGLLKGEADIANFSMSLVDVRDVALAHIEAVEKPEAANQRYILVSEGSTFAQIAEVLREAAPEAPIRPTPHFDKPATPSHFKLDKTVALLGRPLITARQSLIDTTESFRGQF